MAAYTMPESMDVAEFANKPGWYHLAVSDIEESPPKGNDGSVHDALKVSVQILDGTDPTQKRKTTDLWLNNPGPGNKDGGAFLAKVHCRFARACNVLPQAAPGQPIEINWPRAVGQQFVAKLKNKKDSDRLEIDGLHIYHVNDPESQAVPREASALKLATGTPPANGARKHNGEPQNVTVTTPSGQVIPAVASYPAPAAAVATSLDDL